jgi:beta-glucosidase
MTLQAAKEGIVLLKNENDLLPLSKNDGDTLAVVGPMSDVWYKDWYCGVPPYQVTPLQGIQKMNTSITHHNGLDTIVIAYKDKYIGLDDAGNTILVDRQFATEFLHTDWGFGSNTLIDRKTGKYLALNDDTSEISALKTEAFAWFIKEAFDLKKQEDGSFFIDSWNDKHVYVNEAGSLTADMDTDYATFMIEVIEDGIKAAVTTAKSADRAIVFLGSNPVINSKEEIDREDIILPPYQHELIKAVYEANPNTILVLITNYPYAINWEQENIPAILYTASGSQELGNAIASILFGEESPAGRLNMTWYKGVEQLQDINDYDIIRGKRTYQYFDGEVLYPFGYGLSYTRFHYDNLRIKLVDYATISLSVDVQNTGKMAGDEVVQIYVRQEGSRATRPNKQLKAFRRVHLNKAQKLTVTFEIPTEDLKYFDVISNSLVLERGDYRFLVGTSSQDIVLEQSIFIQGAVIGARELTVRTACDRYDCYDNAYLHKGNHGYTCVVPKDTTTKCTLYYRDTIFRKEVHTLDIDLWAVTNGKIEVSLGDTILGSWDIEETDKFVDTVLSIDPSKMALNQVSTLKITIEGDVKVSSFLFV